MRKVIEDDLGEKLGDVFADFDEEPIAAASIGQVYRATLPRRPRRRRQGPVPGHQQRRAGGHAEPRDDPARHASAIAPGLDAKAVGDEIRERIVEELDYELEAANQRSIARVYRGHPFIVIPEVVTRLIRERVIVSEFVEGGRGFEEIKTLPTRTSATGSARSSSASTSAACSATASSRGDPHPGNYLLLPDDRVAFLDFGLFKRMRPTRSSSSCAASARSSTTTPRGSSGCFAENGFLPDPSRFDARAADRPAARRRRPGGTSSDEDVAAHPEHGQRRSRSRRPTRARATSTRCATRRLPTEHLFARRVEMLTMAVLSSCARRTTGSRSRASGSTATSRAPSSAARKPSSTGGRPPRSRVAAVPSPD